MDFFDLASDLDSKLGGNSDFSKKSLHLKYELKRQDIEIVTNEYSRFEMHKGKYNSVENLGDLTDIDKMEYISSVLGNVIFELIPKDIQKGGKNILVVGLGNRGIVADSLGSKVVDKIIVTRHNFETVKTEISGNISSISAFCPNVSGITGIDSKEMIFAVIDKIKPDMLIVVDSLISQDLDNLMNVVQVNNVGITPASYKTTVGICGLSQETLGIPVIALGVPLVASCNRFLTSCGDNLVITSRNIDMRIGKIADVVAYSINLALNKFLTFDDVYDCVR